MRHMLAALCCFTAPAWAQEPPRVVADVAPVRALVAQIMEGVGTPEQIIPTGASPHGYAMRPSEARALRNADLVVWVGPSLTHWLQEPIETLAEGAQMLTLMAHPGTSTLPLRDAEMLEAQAADEDHDHDHDSEHKDADAEHEDDHAEHEDDHAGHDDHGGKDKNHSEEAHEDAGHDDHDHGHAHAGTTDPHGWLAPANAVLWAGVIAQKLAALDPANADTYTRNWEALSDEITSLEAELTQQLAPYTDTPFVVLHDAFQYFEESFGVTATAFVIPGSGQTPGPARIKALRDHLNAHPAVCAFTAPQENEDLLRTALEGQKTRIAVLDPLGTGRETYGTLLRNFADNMVTCLSGKAS